MHKIKRILSGLFLLCTISVAAQTIDTNQAYEIHTLNGLAMDNQESACLEKNLRYGSSSR